MDSQLVPVSSSAASATTSKSTIQFTGRGQACATSEDEPSTFFKVKNQLEMIIRGFIDNRVHINFIIFSIYLQLNGRNEVPFVEMWGWTNNNPISFPTLKENLCKFVSIFQHN